MRIFSITAERTIRFDRVAADFGSFSTKLSKNPGREYRSLRKASGIRTKIARLLKFLFQIEVRIDTRIPIMLEQSWEFPSQ